MSGSLYSATPTLQKHWFVPHLPGESRDYTFDMTGNIATADVVAMVTVAAAPSGAGEASISNPTASGTLLTVTVSGGQPTRTYTYLFTVTMTNGRVYQFAVRQLCAQILQTDAAGVPPSAGFGSAVTAMITSGGTIVGPPTFSAAMANWFATLPTVPQGGTPQLPWNNGGVLSFS